MAKRKLIINYPIDNNNELSIILQNQKVIDGINDRKIKLVVIYDGFKEIVLVGLDGQVKYRGNSVSLDIIDEIFKLIDDMPMRKLELAQSGGNMKLYTDDNPSTTLKGTGYKDKKIAIKTLKLIEKRSIVYQKSLVNTLYNRAKYNKNQTNDMLEAMEVFNNWLTENKNSKRKYDYLDLNTVKFYEKLAKEYDISKVARGLEKSNKSEEGFVVVYKKVKGAFGKLPFIPVFKNKPSGMDYDSFRETFINSRLGQMNHLNTPLYYAEGKYQGLPTKQHVILIMYAYSPDVSKIKKIMKNFHGFKL